MITQIGIAHQFMLERQRQEKLKLDGKFKLSCADLEMSDSEALVVLSEEVGEVAREVCENMYHPLPMKLKLREELVQVGAVVMAWIEKIDEWEQAHSINAQLEENYAKRLDLINQARALQKTP